MPSAPRRLIRLTEVPFEHAARRHQRAHRRVFTEFIVYARLLLTTSQYAIGAFADAHLFPVPAHALLPHARC